MADANQGVQDVAAGAAALVAAGTAPGQGVQQLEDELKALKETQKLKTKEIKKEKAKRDRLMAKAGKSLSLQELSQLVATKTTEALAKAKAKAKPKAVPKAKAVAKAGPVVPPPPLALG